jgi:surface polysaccharide O-acyltransferase-like enzyme
MIKINKIIRFVTTTYLIIGVACTIMTVTFYNHHKTTFNYLDLRWKIYVLLDMVFYTSLILYPLFVLVLLNNLIYSENNSNPKDSIKSLIILIGTVAVGLYCRTICEQIMLHTPV